jgi:glycosyltransferase involved in cell wall biosynthesis
VDRKVRRAILVHEFFVAGNEGGAERCAIEFSRLLPEAGIETTFFDTPRYGDRIDAHRVHTWPLQRISGLARGFRALLPLYPIYFSTLDLRGAELVLSSSVAFAKAVRTSADALHVSYVYTPIRYAWDLDLYLAGSSFSAVSRIAAKTVRPVLKRWDLATARRPDVIVAISATVQERISSIWGRSSEVIYPPVDVDEFNVTPDHDGYLLVAARLLAYRRVDLVVEACNRLKLPLLVVGDGPERARLESMAGPTITFEGKVGRAALVQRFERCRAYVVPGVEDFGIAPVEAQAAGKPIVAFYGGGARETVLEDVTGLFFREPTVDSLVEALGRLDGMTWDPERIRRHAERFAVEVFHRRWRELLARLRVDPGLISPDSGMSRPAARSHTTEPRGIR